MSQNRLKLILVLVVTFVIFYGIFHSIIERNKEDLIQDIYISKVKDLKIHYKHILNDFKIYADLNSKMVQSNTEILSIMKNSKNLSKDEQILEREKLYNITSPIYERLKIIGVTNFQFLFPNNISFLRVHKKERFGDDLSSIRYSFSQTNKNHLAVRGFEHGRVKHAYRYVYPLFDDKKNFLGSFEISFASLHLQDILTKSLKIHTHFLVHKKVFDAKMWKVKNQSYKYIQSIEHPDYLFATNLEMEEASLKREHYCIMKQLKERIRLKMDLKKEFAFEAILKNRVQLLTFLPIENLKDEVVAYLLSYTDNREVFNIYQNSREYKINTFLGLSIMFYFLYLNFLSKLSLKQEVRDKTKVIKEQKNSFENLFKKSSDGIILIQDGEIINCNKSILKMFKYTNKSQLITLYPSKLSPRYQMDGRGSYRKFNEMIEIAFKNHTHSFEWLCKKLDNKEFWVEIVLTQMRENDKNIIHAVYRDISQRKKVEFELEKITKNLESRIKVEVKKNRIKERQLNYHSKLSQMVELISIIGINPEFSNFKDIVKKITEIFSETLNISRVSVWLYNQNRTGLDCISLYLLEHKRHTSGLQLQAKTHLNYIEELDVVDVLVLADAQNSEISQKFTRNYLKPLNIKSIMDIPIRRDGKIIGIVSCEQINEIKNWSQDEIDFSKAMTNAVSLLLEIEQRKKIDLLLAEKTKEQNLLLSLFDMGDSVLFNWNNDRNWSVKSVSSGILNLLGYDEKEFKKGRVYSSCIYKDDLKRVTAEVLNANKSNVKFFKHTPYRVVTKSGKLKWVLDYTVIVRENGTITNYIGYVTDITEQKKKDQQLMAQSRLVQMGEIMSMIAHQWRQPLNAISARSANILIKAQLGKLTNDLVISEASHIDEYSQHLSQTINDFQNFFKPNKQKKEVTFCELLKAVFSIVEISITNKNINLIQDLKCQEKFKTYPSEMKQVILNLIKNSEDIILERKIKNPFIKIATYKSNDNYILEISDNAGGVPEDIIDKIFNPYFSTKSQKNGTGLGLYMSKSIVEEHCGGKLTVSNNEDGAVFKIILI